MWVAGRHAGRSRRRITRQAATHQDGRAGTASPCHRLLLQCTLALSPCVSNPHMAAVAEVGSRREGWCQRPAMQPSSAWQAAVPQARSSRPTSPPIWPASATHQRKRQDRSLGDRLLGERGWECGGARSALGGQLGSAWVREEEDKQGPGGAWLQTASSGRPRASPPSSHQCSQCCGAAAGGQTTPAGVAQQGQQAEHRSVQGAIDSTAQSDAAQAAFSSMAQALPTTAAHSPHHPSTHIGIPLSRRAHPP